MPAIAVIDVLFHPGRCAAAGSSAGVSPATRQPAEPAEVLAAMDAAGVERAFISQCKQWSCERQWMCIDTRLEDVLRFTRHSPRFLGLAGYNPFDIVESLREIEVAASLGFRGVYLHAASFGLALGDARLYPLFAKAAELRAPTIAQLGIAEPALAATVRRICKDVPELTLMLVQPRPDAALLGLAADCENLAFVLDPVALRYLTRSAGVPPATPNVAFFGSPTFAERCCWASNGPSLTDALAGARALPISPENLARFLAHNAARIFGLDQSARPRTPQSLAAELSLAER